MGYGRTGGEMGLKEYARLNTQTRRTKVHIWRVREEREKIARMCRYYM